MSIEIARCAMCKKRKPMSKRQGYCPECKRKYAKDKYYNNALHRVKQITATLAYGKARRTINKEYTQDYLKQHSCIECGNADIRVLEFDHRDPTTKTVEISRAVSSRSMTVLKAEILKCDVRCANCHRIRHYDDPHRGGKARTFDKT